MFIWSQPTKFDKQIRPPPITEPNKASSLSAPKALKNSLNIEWFTDKHFATHAHVPMTG